MAKNTFPPKTQTFPFLDHHWVPETLRISCLNSPQTASRTSMVFFPRSVLYSTGCTTRMSCPRPDGSIERDDLWSLWIECGHISGDVFSVFMGLLLRPLTVQEYVSLGREGNGSGNWACSSCAHTLQRGAPRSPRSLNVSLVFYDIVKAYL